MHAPSVRIPRAMGILAAVLFLPGCISAQIDRPPAPDLADEPVVDRLAALRAGIWSGAADALVPRSEHCVANVGPLFYVIGGFVVPQPVSAPGLPSGFGMLVPTRSVEIYDARTDSFEIGPDYPTLPVDHCVAVTVDDTIYVFHSSDSHRLKAGSTTWERLAHWPNEHRGTAIAQVVDQKVYLIGGLGDGSARVDIYDPETDTWSSLPDDAAIPTPRNHAAGALVEGTIYAIGGDVDGGCGHGCNVDATEALDTATGTWTTKARLPVPRGSLLAFTWHGLIVVMGGQSGRVNVPSVQDVHAYDPATDVWHSLPPMPDPRHGAGAGLWEDQLLLFGGAPQQGASGTAETLRWTIPSPPRG